MALFFESLYLFQSIDMTGSGEQWGAQSSTGLVPPTRCSLGLGWLGCEVYQAQVLQFLKLSAVFHCDSRPSRRSLVCFAAQAECVLCPRDA